MIAGAIIGIAVIAWRCISPVFDIGEVQLLGPIESGARTTLVAHSSGDRKELTYIPYAPAIAAGTIVALWYIGFIPLKFPGWLA
jgi:prepilin signal peptidase PulO-like enzyme (type II secretory pathway)